MAMELMEVKIVRDMRNKVNRVSNCETANIDKTLTASARQIADIEYLILALGIEGLPEELREVAMKRMENPELSLRELLEQLEEPISRSGLNHRLGPALPHGGGAAGEGCPIRIENREEARWNDLYICTFTPSTACWTAPAGSTA